MNGALELSRALQADNDSPSAAPSSMNFDPGEYGEDPTMAPTNEPGPPSKSATAAEGFGWFLLAMLLLLLVIFLYCSCGYCRRKREQRMLDLRSQQADRVLGDMQMVPNEDLDNELL